LEEGGDQGLEAEKKKELAHRVSYPRPSPHSLTAFSSFYAAFAVKIW